MAAAPERSWTEEKERALIAFFSKNSCLWNYKSENYKNRDLRWKTLERLRILLSSQPPPVPFTVEDIKNKFKNLRTTFQHQYKLVRLSGEAGLVPQWKHYQQLSFLQGCCEPQEGADETPPSPPAEENWLPPTSPGLGISFLHSSSSGGAAGRSFWTEERERELIAFYAEHGCLWNRKSENHNNRQLRQKLLESLRIRLSDQLVLFSVEDVKSKFKNLRTVFNREFKAVQASRTSDQPYVSKWKHFHQMLFLCESFEEDEFPDGPREGSRTSCSASSFDACSIKTESNTISCSAFQGLFPAAPDQTELMDPRAASGSPPDRKPGRVLVPADDRASGESRCLWSEAKVQQLISFYAEHSCLWNHRVDSFRNRLLRQSLLETLSGLLSAGEPVPFTGNRAGPEPEPEPEPEPTSFCSPPCSSGRHQDEVQEPADHLPAGAQGGERQQNLRLRGFLPAQVEALPGPAVPLRLRRRRGLRPEPGRPAGLLALLLFLLLLVFDPQQETSGPAGGAAEERAPRRGAARRLPEVRGGMSERGAAAQSEEDEEEDHRDDSQPGGGRMKNTSKNTVEFTAKYWGH